MFINNVMFMYLERVLFMNTMFSTNIISYITMIINL